MPVDDEKQHCIVAGEVRNSESASTGLANLEFELVASIQRCAEVLASLVLHWRVAGEFLGASTEDIESCRQWVGVAHAEAMLELERPHKSAGLIGGR